MHCQGDGINPIGQSHGNRSGGFLNEGEVSIISPVGNGACPIDQSEFKIGLPGERLTGNGDLTRVVEDLRCRPNLIGRSQQNREEGEDESYFHDILKNLNEMDCRVA